MAELVSGSVDLVYSTFHAKDTDATGLSTQTNGTTYFQRYNLSFSRLLYPQLTLQAGGSFDKSITVAEMDDVQTRSTAIEVMPNASLVFFNPFVTSGVGWSRREEKTDSGGASPRTEFQDSKNAFLLFRPEGLPTLNLQFTRSNRYDKERQAENTTSDDFSLNSAYVPVKNLNLSYNAILDKTENKIRETTTTTEQQSGRASYSRQFFKNRVAFTSDYVHTSTVSETSSGHGELKLPLFPFAGLSAISTFNTPPPALPPSPILGAPLSPNQPLIDGNLTASTGMNIGQSLSLPPVNDTRFREVGLDFVTPTAVNTLDVFVVLNQVNQTLPASVADNFTWNIYTSPDNQTWTLYQAGLKAVFDPFSNRFEISFPDVTTRYIMVAVQPLSISVVAPTGTDVSNIFITELQAFIRKPSTLGGGKFSSTSELYDLNVRASLLNDPMLVYNMYYTHMKNDPGYATYTLGNSLSLSKPLSQALTGTARVAREDSGGGAPGASTRNYLYSAALMATPLPTLSSTLVMSGNRLEASDSTSTSNSLFLNSSAQLYRGIDVNLSGGESHLSSSLGSDSENTMINVGASLVPHRNMTISLNYGVTTSRSSLKGVERPILRTNTASTSVAYKPVETVYLFYSISEFSTTNAPRQTAQNYSATWSPFSSGTLQVFLSYTENIQSGAGESFSRLKSAGFSWRVGPRINLSTGYSIAKSESVSQISESKSFNTNLTMSF
jgi:hypothetical protein